MNEATVGVVISSHVSYDLPLNVLLQSLLGCVPPKNIAAVIGGAHRHVSMIQDPLGYTLNWVEDNSFDYTGMIWALDHAPAEWTHIICLHDTMIVGPSFYKKVTNIDPDVDATAVAGGQCNLITMSMKYMQENDFLIRRMKNCTKRQAIDFEGVLFRQTQNRVDYAGAHEVRENKEYSYPYGNVPRIEVLYEGLDIIKLKANHGQTHEGTYIVVP